MGERALPWQVREPGFGGMQWCVVDAGGFLVCECDGEDEGRTLSEEIARVANAVFLLQQAIALHDKIKSARVAEDAFSEHGYRLARVAERSRARIWRRTMGVRADA